MTKVNPTFVLSKAIKYLKKRGVIVFESNPIIKGYSIHNFGKKLKAVIVLKKDTDLNMLLVLCHEIGHCFHITDYMKLVWRPDDREEVANIRASKLLWLIDRKFVNYFARHYKSSMKERKILTKRPKSDKV